MADLSEIVAYLDKELRISHIPDYSRAMNGLQLANEGRVERVIAAVDASLPVVIEAAAEGGAALLIVHHGMFWQGAQAVTGAFYQKIKSAMKAGLAIYSSHLPLDVHPVFGNNVLLAQKIGLSNMRPFFEQNGIHIGIRGDWIGSRAELKCALERVVEGAVHLCPAGHDSIYDVGLITGGAGGEIAKIAEEKVDTFITGEGPHWSYPLAEELKINLLYAGHYATETFGVRALSEHLASIYNLPCSFIDHPTGL